MDIFLNRIVNNNGELSCCLDNENLSEFEKNVRSYISGRCEKIEISLRTKDYKNEKGEYYKYDDLSRSILCLLNDVIDEDSYIYNAYKDQFKSDKLEDTKFTMFQYLLSNFLNAVFNSDIRRNQFDKYTLFASYYHGFCYFKYSLPIELLDNITVMKHESIFVHEIDLSLLDKDSLAKYVIPFYYQDLGYEDRDIIRNKKELMKDLSKNWFKVASQGSLD